MLEFNLINEVGGDVGAVVEGGVEGECEVGGEVGAGAGSGSGAEAYVDLETKRFEVLLKKLEFLDLNRIRNYLGGKKGVVNLILVDDKAIRKLNKKYRKIDKPTDVLSFQYLDGCIFMNETCNIVQAGDIFISVETAKRQSKIHSHSLKSEFEILFVHGLLHLFGYDHKTDEQEEEMNMVADKILN